MTIISSKGVVIAELAEVAAANFVTHATWVQRRTAGMHVVETDELVMVDCGLPCDTFNFVCRARLAGDAAVERIEAALGYFAGVGRPFSWWVGPGDQPAELGELLVGVGLERAETEVAMAADLATLRIGDLAPGGLEIRRMRTEVELQDFAQIIAAGWTPPDVEVLRFYTLAAPALLREDAPLRLYVGYVRDVPVATAELAISAGVVGLYNIVTLEEYRRRGFGSAMTLQPLLEARAQGYRTGILQAAAAGVGVYTRVGFEPFGQITEYKPA